MKNYLIRTAIVLVCSASNVSFSQTVLLPAISTTPALNIETNPSSLTSYYEDRIGSTYQGNTYSLYPTVVRLGDRVTIGAANISDFTFGGNGNGSWTASMGLDTGYLLRDATLAVISGGAGGAIFGASRNSDAQVAGISAYGITGLGLADTSSVEAAHGGYLEAHTTAANSSAIGLEIESVQNYSGYLNTLYANPYALNPSGGAYGLLVNSGGDPRSEMQVYPSNFAFGVSTTGSTPTGGVPPSFFRGLVFGATSLVGTDGSTGTGIAISMAKGHQIQWDYDYSDTPSAFIRSDGTTGGLGFVFNNNGLNIENNAGSIFATFGSSGGLNLAAGALTVPADPTTPLGVATKEYVDAAAANAMNASNITTGTVAPARLPPVTALTGYASNNQTFTTFSTWTKTGSPQTVCYLLIGGGGGGGGGGSVGATTSGSGGGGGGAAEVRGPECMPAALISSSVTITVGSSGAGGGSAANGTSGGTSSFGPYAIAYGGGGGGQGASGAASAGGPGAGSNASGNASTGSTPGLTGLFGANPLAGATGTSGTSTAAITLGSSGGGTNSVGVASSGGSSLGVPTGGGSGGGMNAGVPAPGAPGGTSIVNPSAGGAQSTTTTGGVGLPAATTDVIGLFAGGGGGGGASSAGAGGAGGGCSTAIYGAGGGGGGSGTTSGGSGGAGCQGVVYVWQF